MNSTDAEAFFRLRLRALEDEPRAFGASVEEDRTMPMETVASRLEPKEDGSFVVGAFAEGGLVGTAGFYREQRVKTRHKGFVWGVYVAPEWRGQSVAKQMMSMLIERLRSYPDLDHIMLHVSVDQQPARRVYASVGFEAIGYERRAFKIGDEFVDQEMMGLWL